MDQVTELSRFFDVETSGAIQLQLQQDGADYRVLRQFGYCDPDPKYTEPFVVPKDVKTFSTDLASIPPLFSWLVPGLGSHLPAILLHDALVVGPAEPPTHLGPGVDRVEADRILRDAMASLGTPRIRRWLIWAATIIATCWAALQPRWWWRSVVVGTIAIVVALGTLATLDVIDAWDVLPWMGDRPWWFEVITGAVVAVLVPLVISLAWRRLWRAGVITGVALAFLLHVTVVLFVLYRGYRLMEAVVSRSEGTTADVHRNLEAAVETSPAR